MNKYRFEQIAINCTEKRKPNEADMESYIGLEHLDPGTLTVSRWGSVVPIKGEKLVMHKGDVLLGKRNAYLRRAAIAPHDGLFSAHGMVLNPHEEIIDKDFFPHFILSDCFFDEAIKISVGSLSPTINWRDIAKVEFFLPDLAKQRELAKILSTITEAINCYRDLIAITDELVKAQFIEMFGDPLVDTGTYRRMTILDACDKITGGGTPSKKHPEYFQGSIPWVSPKDMKSNLIEDSQDHITELAVEKSTTKIVPENSVLMVIRSGVLKHDLPIAINTVPVTINQDMKAFIVGSRITPQYLFGYLKTIEADVLKGVRAVTADNIEFKSFQNRLIQIPPKEEQVLFADFMQQCDKSKSELNQALDSSTAMYKRILQEALTADN